MYISVRQLSDHLGISKTYIQRILKGSEDKKTQAKYRDIYTGWGVKSFQLVGDQYMLKMGKDFELQSQD